MSNKNANLGVSVKLTDLISSKLRKIENSLDALGNKSAKASKLSSAANSTHKKSLDAISSSTVKATASTNKMSGALTKVKSLTDKLLGRANKPLVNGDTSKIQAIEDKLKRVKALQESISAKKSSLGVNTAGAEAAEKKLSRLKAMASSLENKKINLSTPSNLSKSYGSLAKDGAIGGALVMGSIRAGQGLNTQYQKYVTQAARQGELMTLGINEKGIKTITSLGLDFSNKYAGVTTNDFLAAAYDIRSGIASLSDMGVGKMTSLAALTARATKGSVEQMSSLFATGYNIYNKQFDEFASTHIAGWEKLSQEEKDIKFGESFSGGISKSVQMFKTKGSEMEGYISSLGGSATLSGMSMQEQFAVGGMLQSTLSGSEAGTSYKAFLRGIGSAQEDMNIKLTDAKGQALSTVEILDKLKAKFGDTLDVAEKGLLSKSFGEEGVKVVELLLNRVDELKKNTQQLNQATAAGASTTEAMAQSANYRQESVRLGQQIDNLATMFGESLAPAIGFAADALGFIILQAQDFGREHSTLTSIIGTSLVIFTGLVSVLGSIKFMSSMAAISLRIFGVAGVSAGAGATSAAGGIRILTASLWGFIGVAAIAVGLLAALAGAQRGDLNLKRTSGKDINALIADNKSIDEKLNAHKNGGIAGAWENFKGTSNPKILEAQKKRNNNLIKNMQKQEADKAITLYNAEKALNNLSNKGGSGGGIGGGLSKKSGKGGSGGGGGGGGSGYGLKDQTQDLIRNQNEQNIGKKISDLGDRLTIPCPLNPVNSWGTKTITSGGSPLASIKDFFNETISAPKDMLTNVASKAMSVIEGDMHITINGYQKSPEELVQIIENRINANRRSQVDRSMYS